MPQNQSFAYKKRKPRIGVTGPDRGGAAAWIFTAISVLLQGGIPKRIMPDKPRNIDKIDGLIIGGGADVHPELYGNGDVKKYLIDKLESPKRNLLHKLKNYLAFTFYPLTYVIRRMLSKKSSATDEGRDKLELYLIDHAYKHNIPMMGICRGEQLINVYFEGTLHQDLDEFYEEAPNVASVFPVKRVKVAENSKLFEIVQSRMLWVNALHQQAVNNPGNGIKMVAHEDNGVVQAIEHHPSDFIIGVQWHPEYLIPRIKHRRLFRKLVLEAKKIKVKGQAQ